MPPPAQPPPSDGDLLRQLQAVTGLSRRELGRQLDIGHVTIRDAELERTRVPVHVRVWVAKTLDYWTQNPPPRWYVGPRRRQRHGNNNANHK